MKKEAIWFSAIVALVALAIFAAARLPVRYGLDINGGVRAVLAAVVKPGQAYDSAKMLNVLQDRLNSSGVAEPQITPKGDREFIVELPNVHNKDAVIQQLQSTAQLEFLWLKDVASPRNPNARFSYTVANDAQNRPLYTFTDQKDQQSFRDQAQIVGDLQSQVLVDSLPRAGATATPLPPLLQPFAPEGQTLYLDAAQQLTVKALAKELAHWQGFYSLELSATGGKPILTGADVLSNSTASIGSGSNPTEPVTNVQFNAKGTQEFGDFTREHVGDITAIVLNGRVVDSPSIQEEIPDGACTISGAANIADAQQLANTLNAGSLPVPLRIEQVTSVDPPGAGSVRHMITAGLIGLALVLVFMAWRYLLPGLVADVALLFYALFALAIFKGGLSWFIPPVTLTLAGIAGFILSIGMAVDANILIFERLKEELRSGRSLRAAIDAGFSRAFPAIRDSNICTLITCTILYSMGTPEVKGFALTLGIGVVVSFFTATTATRSMLYLLVDLGAAKYPALFGFNQRALAQKPAASAAPARTANVVGARRFFYLLSALIIVPGIVFFALGGLKRSIEFKGGTQITAVFPRPVAQEAIRKALTAGGYRDPLVQMASGGTIAYVSVDDRSPDAYHQVEATLDQAGLTNTMQEHGVVGGSISRELTRNAFEAVVIAAALIVIYMASTFAIGGFVAGLRFGTSAIAALLHDVLVLIGAFAILGYFLDWQIDSLFITAVLTVVGFSVHDTIVIFDRLRENLRRRARGQSFEQLANTSILQSMNRSVNTSFTVVLTLLALLIFGEPSTRLLIVALLIGIVSGTYSSIFNATPILVDWENAIARRQGMARATPAMVDPEPVGAGTAAAGLAAAQAPGSWERKLVAAGDVGVGGGPILGSVPTVADNLTEGEGIMIGADANGDGNGDGDGGAASRANAPGPRTSVARPRKRPARRF